VPASRGDVSRRANQVIPPEPDRGAVRLITVTRLSNLVLAGLLAAALAGCGKAGSAAAGPAVGSAAAGSPAASSPAVSFSATGSPATVARGSTAPFPGVTGSPAVPGRCRAHAVAREPDNGATICVAPGSDLVVMLRSPHGTNWSSPQVTGSALGPARPVPTPSHYVGWSFTAVAAGTAEISLSRPACPPAGAGGAACAALLLYHLHVKVR
jgi:hypothetical protein